jgi:metal-responsive CopG/Arc/MetJ family transcriptional regulator
MAATTKIAISIDKKVLNRIDRLVEKKCFPTEAELFKPQ